MKKLLSEIKQKLSKTITLTIPISKVNKPFVDDLYNIVEEKKEGVKGTCKLKVVLTDSKKVNVNLFSRNIKLNITNELIENLYELEEEGVSYKVN